jgi:signal transduction histidine kinase
MPSLTLKTLPLVSQIISLKAIGSAEAAAIPYEWLAFGFSFGVLALFFISLYFFASALRPSVLISQALFVGAALASLSWAYFQPHWATVLGQPIFDVFIRLELILSTVTTFNLVKPTRGKQHLGSIYSAFLGSVVGASLLNFVWPLGALLYGSELVLIAASLYLGCRFLYSRGGLRPGGKTLMFQLATVLMVSGTYAWLPDLAKFDESGRIILSAATSAIALMAAATVYASSKQRYHTLIANLRRDLFVSGRRVAEKSEVTQSLQAEVQTLSERLQHESLSHRQDSIRDHLRIRALEESSQDIARGLLAYLRELQDDCNLILSEARSPQHRLSFIRAYAERTHILSSRIQNAAGFLFSAEASLTATDDTRVVIAAADFIKECLYLCSHRFRKVGIEIEIQSLQTDLWVRGHPALLAQGFLGLIYNALEATSTSDVRRVTLRLRKVVDEEQAFVEFGISNSGPGIPTAIKTKAFYLKDRDGLGVHSLGLSMAFGIFEHAGGSLSLDTDAVATTLLARLPLVSKKEESSLKLVI